MLSSLAGVREGKGVRKGALLSMNSIELLN